MAELGMTLVVGAVALLMMFRPSALENRYKVDTRDPYDPRLDIEWLCDIYDYDYTVSDLAFLEWCTSARANQIVNRLAGLGYLERLDAEYMRLTAAGIDAVLVERRADI